MKRFVIKVALALVFLCSWIGTTSGQGTPAKPPPKAEPKAGPVRKVDVNEFEKLWKDKTNIVLDVRTPREYASGHIQRAILIDANSQEFEHNISKLDKQKTYLVYCGAGVRSARACEKLAGLGFTNLVDLPAGFKGWEKAGKQVEK